LGHSEKKFSVGRGAAYRIRLGDRSREDEYSEDVCRQEARAGRALARIGDEVWPEVRHAVVRRGHNDE
jgi:hypothetical protein